MEFANFSILKHLRFILLNDSHGNAVHLLLQYKHTALYPFGTYRICLFIFVCLFLFYHYLKRETVWEKKNRKYLQISTDEIVSLFFIWINLSAQWNRERDKLNKLPKKPIQYNVYAVRTVQTITTVIDGWWSESNERRIGKI